MALTCNRALVKFRLLLKNHLRGVPPISPVAVPFYLQTKFKINLRYATGFPPFQVSAIYQDPSLEANLQLVVSRLLMYDIKKQSALVRPGNSRKSLENVNSWNRRLHASLGPKDQPHDVAIWITRVDIGGPSGYAPVSGACDPKRSCALIRDEGLTSSFIIAHEMGHM